MAIGQGIAVLLGLLFGSVLAWSWLRARSAGRDACLALTDKDLQVAREELRRLKAAAG